MGLLASLMAPVAWAQTGAEQTLLDQGQYWQERGDTERAGEAWQKLLRINPRTPRPSMGWRWWSSTPAAPRAPSAT